MKRLMFAAMLCFLTYTVVSAQQIEMDTTSNNFPKWGVGLHIGLSQHGTDTHSWSRHGESLFSKAQFMYGLNARYNINEAFAIRANYFGSKMKGDDNDLDGPCSDPADNDPGGDCHVGRGWSMESPLHEVSLDLEWDILGKKRYGHAKYYDGEGNRVDNEDLDFAKSNYYDKKGNLKAPEKRGFKKMISPYVTAGVALTFTDPTIDFGNMVTPSPEDVNNDFNARKRPYVQLPLGVGLRFDLSEKLHIDLEARGVIVTTDLLDGMRDVTRFEDERNNEDSYQFAGIRLGYRFGEDNDKDNDGIADEDDSCPYVFGIASANGCPDADLDGIIDSKDSCPTIAGIASANGCPDADADGVIDSKDDCPNIYGTVKGCPDTDGDKVIDKMDACPQTYGTIEGCPDTDGDGIVDSKDPCPKVAGPNGCPLDKDKDGVSDDNDPCPNVYGNFNGCPDSDRDGIPDNLDNCPKKGGNVDAKGCPKVVSRVVTNTTPAAVSSVFTRALKGVQFHTSKSTIKRSSNSILNEVVNVMREYPDISVNIYGHTDSRGDDTMNMDLSKRRAEAVKAYLVGQGVSSNRLYTAGFGETSPVSDNNTREGRALNRRVEFQVKR